MDVNWHKKTRLTDAMEISPCARVNLVKKILLWEENHEIGNFIL